MHEFQAFSFAATAVGFTPISLQDPRKTTFTNNYGKYVVFLDEQGLALFQRKQPMVYESMTRVPPHSTETISEMVTTLVALAEVQNGR